MPEAPDSVLGSRVGHIRVVERLGAGGMGEVFVGFDETLRRKVALKVIAGSHRLSKAARARFVREARLLSRLDHPNICRVYDFIEQRDREVLVLELIDGRDLRAALGTGLEHREKLRIARDVAGVLAAAHSEGIVHRDLKPGNVMLTASGEVKVLDFGLARSLEEPNAPIDETCGIGADPEPERAGKALSALEPRRPAGDEGPPAPASLRTERGAVLGTPQFMSPEQARGEPATTASDMYSFGLLMQTLFTERPPYPDGLSAAEVLELARRAETLPLPGIESDLGRLVEQLRSPAPAARPTAATALERLEWILAKPKRRVRWLIAAGLLLILGLGSAKYTWDLAVARDDADRRRSQAEDLLGFMVGDLRESLEPIGRLDLLDEVGDRAMEYFRAARSEDLSDEELSRQAQALTQLGAVRMDQRRYDDALGFFEEAHARSAELVERFPGDGDRLFDRGQAEFWVGYVHWRRRRLDDAQHWLARYRDSSEALLALDPTRDDWALEVVSGHHNLAVLLLEDEKLAEAAATFHREVEALEVLAVRIPEDDSLSEDLADALSWSGTVARRRGDLISAAEHFGRSAALRAARVEAEPDNAHNRYWWAHALSFEAQIAAMTGALDEALDRYDRALQALEELTAADPLNVEWSRMRAATRTHRAELVAAAGEPSAARREAELALESLRALIDAEPTDANARYALVTNLRLQAQVEALLGERRKALAVVDRAREAALELGEAAGRDPRRIGAVATTLIVSSQLHEEAGDSHAATALRLEAQRLLRDLVARSDNPDLLDPWCRVLLLSGDDDLATPLIDALAGRGYRPLWPWPLEARARADRLDSGIGHVNP